MGVESVASGTSIYQNLVRTLTKFPFANPNEKHCHRQNCWSNVTREETSKSISGMFVKSKAT